MWHNQHIWKTGQDTLRVETWLRINHWMVFPCLCHLLIKTILVITLLSLNFCLLRSTEPEKRDQPPGKISSRMELNSIFEERVKSFLARILGFDEEQAWKTPKICSWFVKSAFKDQNCLTMFSISALFLGVKLRLKDACMNVEKRNRKF